jgi:hypothetical protein
VVAKPTVCAVVVNWNGWRDTIVCVESLLALQEDLLRVVICDNGSADESAAQLEAWIASLATRQRAALHLLALPVNLGYAGGVNAGTRWAQESWHPHAFWILNNDLVAQRGALRALVAASEQVPDAGLCGSVLLEWDDPSQVQAVGGVYCRWLGVGRHVTRLPRPCGISLDMDYPVGASLYVTQAYIDRVGLMEEGYFLYYEEMDWVERGRRRGFRPVIALDSRLRHKEGASTGSHGGVRRKSILSERYGVINRLRITHRFWPRYLPVVWLSLWLVAGDRLVHREFARARLVLRIMFSPRLWLH